MSSTLPLSYTVEPCSNNDFTAGAELIAHTQAAKSHLRFARSVAGQWQLCALCVHVKDASHQVMEWTQGMENLAECQRMLELALEQGAYVSADFTAVYVYMDEQTAHLDFNPSCGQGFELMLPVAGLRELQEQLAQIR